MKFTGTKLIGSSLITLHEIIITVGDEREEKIRRTSQGELLQEGRIDL